MKKKKVIILVISILIILILLLVLSYAFFKTQLSGTEGIVKVGELELVLNETSEGIKLDNAIGLSDSEGLSLDSSTFKLINNGSKAVDYIIYLDDNTIGDTDTRISDKYLKYNLNKNGKDSGPTPLTSVGSNKNRVLDSGTIEGKGTNEYSLNLWITSDVDGNYSGQVFSGKLRVEVSQEKDKSVAAVVMNNIGEKGNLYDDGVDTFITGSAPNNYIWYSGKLWRAVSVNNEEKTVKLVTQWNISAVTYNPVDKTNFEGSYIEDWLNDTTVDGFLSNLRDYENFIVTDSVWDATMDDTALGSLEGPNRTATTTAPVGLLNMYEYQTSYHGTTYSNGYLNNGLVWWNLTPVSSSDVVIVDHLGLAPGRLLSHVYGVRPSINLKSNIKIVKGNGTKENPYRLQGDNDTNLSGTLLSSRYSGEYVLFGNDENNLYRIVSHENGSLTKIVSEKPLKNSGKFIERVFGGDSTFSSSNTIGSFLNGDYLTNYVDSKYLNMIEDNTTWYLGTVGDGISYKLAKYTNTTDNILTSSTANAKVGLLRFGELMTGQFDRFGYTRSYWTLTPYNSDIISVDGYGNMRIPGVRNVDGIRPSLNLKSKVIITSGNGTLQNPFQITLK